MLSRLIVVVDLDGTLSDHSRRVHLVGNKDWPAYHEGLEDDRVHGDVAFALAAFAAAGARIIVCTGRPEHYRLGTEFWLLKHKIPAEAVLMRRSGDSGSDAEIKLKLLEQWRADDFARSGAVYSDQEIIVLDDRDKVVEAWRNAGLTCWQVRAGDY